MVTTEMWSSVFKRRRLFHRQFFWNTLNFSSCQNWLPKQNFVQLVLVQLCSGRRSMWEVYYNKRDPLKILKCCLPKLVLSLKRDLNDHSTFCFAAQSKLSLNIMAEYYTLDSIDDFLCCCTTIESVDSVGGTSLVDTCCPSTVQVSVFPLGFISVNRWSSLPRRRMMFWNLSSCCSTLSVSLEIFSFICTRAGFTYVCWVAECLFGEPNSTSFCLHVRFLFGYSTQ